MKDIHHIHNLMLFDSPNINLRGCEQSCQFRFRPPFRFAPKYEKFWSIRNFDEPLWSYASEK